MATEITPHTRQRDPYAPIDVERLVSQKHAEWDRRLSSKGLTLPPEAIRPLVGKLVSTARVTLYLEPLSDKLVSNAVRTGIINPVNRTSETTPPPHSRETTLGSANPSQADKSSLPRKLRSAVGTLRRVPGLSSLF